MKTALLLDGSRNNDATAGRVRSRLEPLLEAQGYEIEYVALRERKIGPCMGDFFCWIRTPGTCMQDDDNREIAAKVVHSDLLVFLTPVVFGGYSSVLKRMVDHFPQNALPFFEKVDGEVHHARRYPHQADFLALGWQEHPDPQEAAVFRRLTGRNANNFRPKRRAGAVLGAWQSDAELDAELDSCLERFSRGKDPGPHTTEFSPLPADLLPPRRALLLVGSPRGRKSTSHSLGEHLLEKLAAQGIATGTILLQTAVATCERTKDLIAQVDAADLVVLAFPLYVDSLPSPAIEALESLVDFRQGSSDKKRFAAIANCGFPEAFHNDVALSQCRLFAPQAGMEWAGCLALGAGEGQVHGEPLKKLGATVRSVARVLDQAASHLARGEAIPPELQKSWNRPFIPSWLYRTIGSVIWHLQARRWEARHKLRDAPYEI